MLIILLLACVDIPIHSADIAVFRESIGRVDDFLANIIQKERKQDIIFTCLQELYTIIMTIGK